MGRRYGFVLATSLFAACGTGTHGDARDPAVHGTAALAASARARELYRDHCALCHGATGRGDGSAAHLLQPPARDFGTGEFLLVSSLGGPSTDDLVATLRRGMPGSAMPSFGWLPDADLTGLAQHVLGLAREGLARGGGGRAADANEDAERTWIARRLAPGAPFPALPRSAPNESTRARGAALFGEHCAACHGADGRGRGSVHLAQSDGTPTLARDFTQGVLKGGAGARDLANRIRAGMPGSSMPAFDLSPADLTALVQHLESKIPEGAAERFRQRRETLVATRIERAPDGAPAPADWERAKPLELHTAPLAWHRGAVLGVRVAALHDGERLWLRLAWQDDSRDDRLVGGTPYPDAVAVQLSDAPQPPLFGMGSPEAPVNLWHWTAASWQEVSGLLDPLGAPRHDGALYVPTHSSGSGRELSAAGAGNPTPATSLAARSDWKEGTWTVTLSRALVGGEPLALTLVPGAEVQFGVAVWNGAAGEAGGNKSITIWHALRMQP